MSDLRSGYQLNRGKVVDGKTRVSSTSYLYDIAEGNITGHTVWSKTGYAVMPATTETDIYSYGGTIPVIPFKATGSTMRVVTANAADAGAAIKGDATGDTVTSDAGGTLTTLVDADVDFEAATAVAAGDCVILDPHGTTPEWGFVTGVATHTLTLASGFSSGGTGASRKYAVIDYSPQVGCHAVVINYLDSTYATKREIVVTNGAQANGVVTIGADLLRINSFRVIATGSAGKPTAAIILGDNATPPTIIYTYITAGFTRARNSIYTVPLGKTLYITHWVPSYGAAANKVEFCRLYVRIAQYTNEIGTTNFRTNITPGVVIWYPYAEIVVSNSALHVEFETPIVVYEKTSLKVSGTANGAGTVSTVLRGWLE